WSAVGNAFRCEKLPCSLTLLRRRADCDGSLCSIDCESLDQIKVIVNLMLVTACGRDGIRQHPSPAISGVTDSFRHSAGKHRESRFKRIRKQHRNIESEPANARNDSGPLAKAGRFWLAPHTIDERCRREQAGNPGPRENRHLRSGEVLPYGLHRRDREYGVPDPI